MPCCCGAAATIESGDAVRTMRERLLLMCLIGTCVCGAGPSNTLAHDNPAISITSASIENRLYYVLDNGVLNIGVSKDATEILIARTRGPESIWSSKRHNRFVLWPMMRYGRNSMAEKNSMGIGPWYFLSYGKPSRTVIQTNALSASVTMIFDAAELHWEKAGDQTVPVPSDLISAELTIRLENGKPYLMCECRNTVKRDIHQHQGGNLLALSCPEQYGTYVLGTPTHDSGAYRPDQTHIDMFSRLADGSYRLFRSTDFDKGPFTTIRTSNEFKDYVIMTDSENIALLYFPDWKNMADTGTYTDQSRYVIPNNQIQMNGSEVTVFVAQAGTGAGELVTTVKKGEYTNRCVLFFGSHTDEPMKYDEIVEDLKKHLAGTREKPAK